MDMINSGELDGTYINIQGKYTFSKEKIIDWANKTWKNNPYLSSQLFYVPDFKWVHIFLHIYLMHPF